MLFGAKCNLRVCGRMLLMEGVALLVLACDTSKCGELEYGKHAIFVMSMLVYLNPCNLTHSHF